MPKRVARAINIAEGQGPLIGENRGTVNIHYHEGASDGPRRGPWIVLILLLLSVLLSGSFDPLLNTLTDPLPSFLPSG